MPYFRAKAGMAYALPAGMGSAEAVRLSINRNARTRKPQISEDASHDILHLFDDEPQSNIPPPLLDEKKQPDSKIPQPREREEARADLPSWPHRIIRYRPKTERRLLYNAPIENRSLFSVKKRAPNPQIPEPGRMLLRQKFECKSFLILMKRIFHTWFWYWVFACNRALLAMLAPPEMAANAGIAKFSLWNCWVRIANNERDAGFDHGVQKSRKKCYSRRTA
jgi:hypothetical protein